MIHNWLCKKVLFLFSTGFLKALHPCRLLSSGCNALCFSTIPWLTSSSWHPCTAWFIHSSFKKIRGYNELRWLNEHYVRRLSRLPTSWSWHSTKCHLSEGALKSDRPLWLSCSAGQGLSSPGSHPQRAFSLSGAECKSKTSNRTLFKFRIYPVQSQSKVRQNRGG